MDTIELIFMRQNFVDDDKLATCPSGCFSGRTKTYFVSFFGIEVVARRVTTSKNMYVGGSTHREVRGNTSRIVDLRAKEKIHRDLFEWFSSVL